MYCYVEKLSLCIKLCSFCVGGAHKVCPTYNSRFSRIFFDKSHGNSNIPRFLQMKPELGRHFYKSDQFLAIAYKQLSPVPAWVEEPARHILIMVLPTYPTLKKRQKYIKPQTEQLPLCRACLFTIFFMIAPKNDKKNNHACALLETLWIFIFVAEHYPGCRLSKVTYLCQCVFRRRRRTRPI